MRLIITSLSLVVWNTAPSSSMRARIGLALVKLPLWARASRPLLERTVMGWALKRRLEPVVE